MGAVYQLGLTCIVSPTNTGATVALISAAYRPGAPVLALSPGLDVVRRCCLLWGVHPQQNEDPLDTLELVEHAQRGLQGRALEAGDKIGVTAGLPAGRSGGKNLFRFTPWSSRPGARGLGARQASGATGRLGERPRELLLPVADRRPARVSRARARARAP